MTKQEIISKYERKTGKKAYTVLGGDIYIYMFNDGSFCFKKHSLLGWCNPIEKYCIGVYAIGFFNGMVEIRSINKKGEDYNIYFGKYDN